MDNTLENQNIKHYISIFLKHFELGVKLQK